jgi:hypothetical protein
VIPNHINLLKADLSDWAVEAGCETPKEGPCTVIIPEGAPVLFKGVRQQIWGGMKLPRILTSAPRVYVDAKILNMHNPALQKEAYVGYFVEGDGRKGVRRVEATESDDAEILAILFAIEELRGSLGRFTIVCDHESVVSEAKREVVKNPSELLGRLRGVLRDNPSVRLEALQANPAHGVVTEYVNELGSNPR